MRANNESKVAEFGGHHKNAMGFLVIEELGCVSQVKENLAKYIMSIWGIRADVLSIPKWKEDPPKSCLTYTECDHVKVTFQSSIMCIYK